MSEPAEGRVRVVVIPVEPGLVYVKLMDPKPAPDLTESCLRQTINQWFKAHPGFVIDRAETVTDHGQMQGVQVWYHDGAPSSEPATSAYGPAPTAFSIEVHKGVADRFPKEYIEAVISDAMLILPAYAHRQDTLVVINPRRLAVILDGQVSRGVMIPVELIEQVIEGPKLDRLEQWLAAPKSRFYVMHIAGSWFGGR
jgi:hypothetical protein